LSHFVYIVRCANDALYTGYAVDVAARVTKHNAGKGAKYTRINGPVVLLASWQVASRIEALKLERRIKALPRAHKLALVSGERALPSIETMSAAAIFPKKPKRKRRAIRRTRKGTARTSTKTQSKTKRRTARRPLARILRQAQDA
jgi:putative endonuclease